MQAPPCADEATNASQAYIQRITGSLDSGDFQANLWVRFVCTEPGVKEPANLDNQWFHLSAGADAEALWWTSTDELVQTAVFVMFADLLSEDQRQAVTDFGNYLAQHDQYAPPVLLVPSMSSSPDGEAEIIRRVKALLEGEVLDDVIWRPTGGQALAFAIQAKLQSLITKIGRYDDDMARRTAARKAKGALSCSLHHMRWEYLRTRGFHLPPLRNGLPESRNRRIGDFSLGRAVMRSPFGFVFSTTAPTPEANANGEGEELPPPPAAGPGASSFLVVEKNQVKTISSLRMLSRSLGALSALRNVHHPNLPRLLDSFQTLKRVYVHLELSADYTLFARLKNRDTPKEGAQRQPLPAAALQSLVAQVGSAVGHLHQVPQIAHRDLKPENVVVREQQNDDGTVSFCAKLGGFELATTEREARLPCGTLPFAAPEVILASDDQWYDCFAADVWSLGVLLVEITCGLKSINAELPEDAVAVVCSGSLLDSRSFQAPGHGVAHSISDAFGRPGFVSKFLGKHTLPEAEEMRSWLEPAVESMVQVDPRLRLASSSLHDTLRAR